MKKEGLGMGKIFIGQTALRITLNTFCDLEDVNQAVIKYRKPDGSTGEFAAAVGDTAKGVIFYECIEGDLNISGWWSFWAFATFADGRLAAGETAKVYIWEEGK
jgi:hypothetical protein